MRVIWRDGLGCVMVSLWECGGFREREGFREKHRNSDIIYTRHCGHTRSCGERSVNIYYPFSLKEEWSLAQWSLYSRLLMRAINEFLALPIASPELHPTSSSLMNHQVQKLSLSFATANMFPKPPSGRCKIFPLKDMKLQNQLCYSTGIQWNVYRHFSITRSSRKSRILSLSWFKMISITRTESIVSGSQVMEHGPYRYTQLLTFPADASLIPFSLLFVGDDWGIKKRMWPSKSLRNTPCMDATFNGLQTMFK